MTFNCCLSDTANMDSNYEALQASGSELMEQPFEEDSLTDWFDDEIICFPGNTAIGNNRANPFLWRNTSQCRYPQVSLLSGDILSSQASYAAKKEVFSEAGHLTAAHQARPSDWSISLGMMISTCTRLFFQWENRKWDSLLQVFMLP